MLFLFHLGGNNKKIFSSLFHSRDKPRNSTAGSAYRFYMGSSTAGKNVTEHSAMQMTAVYSCVRILSEAVAGLPLHLYKYTDTGSAKATNHPLYALLHDGPNPEMTSFMFLETLMTHLLLWGNAYAQIIRNGKGEVVVIYPLMPDRMTVDRDENGMLYYEYQTNSGDAPVNKQSTVRLAPTDVLHIAGLGFDGLGAAGEFLGNAKAVSLLAIEKIKSGDKVISTDPETMETSPKTVLETYIRVVTTLVHLTVNGEEIVTTVDHPFYVKNQGFIKAGELIVGDELLDVNGNILLVENFDVELTDKPVKVYNFQVEDFHTYYVGGFRILVHNAGDAYKRPSGYRKGVRDKTWEEAKANSPDGIVRDPKTGKPINPNEPWDMGHKPGYEFRKHRASAQERGIDRKQFLDEHNDSSHYRPELPSSNRSHSCEDMTDQYLGP